LSRGSSKDSKASAPPDAAVPLTDLLSHPLALQRRQVRAWLEANAADVSISFALIEEILELAIGPAGKKLELPGGGSPRSVRRSRNELALECRAIANVTGYEYALPVPGDVIIPELSARIEAQLVNVESIREPERSVLLDLDRLGHTLTIRNWRAGDRYWPAHTASEKKVKELLADRHATGAKKKLWPVAIDKEGSLVWMRGFAAPVSFRPRSAKAIWIREIPPKP
jgi:tRNA(Ile)-lysidine synthetase-like protein